MNCPDDPVALIELVGWRAEVKGPPAVTGPALYCRRCERYFVEADGRAVEADAAWRNVSH